MKREMQAVKFGRRHRESVISVPQCMNEFISTFMNEGETDTFYSGVFGSSRGVISRFAH